METRQLRGTAYKVVTGREEAGTGSCVVVVIDDKAVAALAPDAPESRDFDVRCVRAVLETARSHSSVRVLVCTGFADLEVVQGMLAADIADRAVRCLVDIQAGEYGEAFPVGAQTYRTLIRDWKLDPSFCIPMTKSLDTELANEFGIEDWISKYVDPCSGAVVGSPAGAVESIKRDVESRLNSWLSLEKRLWPDEYALWFSSGTIRSKVPHDYPLDDPAARALMAQAFKSYFARLRVSAPEAWFDDNCRGKVASLEVLHGVLKRFVGAEAVTHAGSKQWPCMGHIPLLFAVAGGPAADGWVQRFVWSDMQLWRLIASRGSREDARALTFAVIGLAETLARNQRSKQPLVRAVDFIVGPTAVRIELDDSLAEVAAAVQAGTETGSAPTRLLEIQRRLTAESQASCELLTQPERSELWFKCLA